MRKKLLCLFLAFICFDSAFTQTVFKEFADGRVYVKFTKSSLKTISKEDPKNIPLTKFEILKDLVGKYGVTKVYKPFYQADDDNILPYILKIEFSKAREINSLMNDLNSIAGVEYVEKVRLNKTDVVPNDPLFATANGSTHLNQINAQNAWNVFNGNSNITVAIVDNAIMSTHVDLLSNIYTNALEASGTAGVDDDGNGYIDDIHGYDVAGLDGITNPTNTAQDHGTHCSGIAGSDNNNSIGVASIGWNIKIIPVKCSYDYSPTLDVDYGYEGIIYAVKAKAKIISCSWGNSGPPSQTEQSVINYAWNRGCILFASAGNLSSSNKNYPAAYTHAYCVASVDPSDVKSSFSNYGSWVDIAAPGNNILSTVPYVTTPAYVPYSGTSMATPMVAGLAGLMLSKSPTMTRQDVLNCLASTAVNIYSISGNSSYVAGSQLGVGRIDAFAAMTCAAGYSLAAPVANFYAFLPNTCPNTLIPFVDSSLYSPTSWSWIFQNGTPATSTSSNPSVQWTTPGIYSVSLTVTNANGTSTKTKLSYINVSGPAALPFSEGFQSLAFLPANWTPYNLWNDSIYWERVTPVGGYGTSTACAMFNNFLYNAPGERDEMRTPSFDFSNVANVRLQFDVAYARYDASYSDSLEVKVSANCGTTWTNVYLKGGTGLATSPDYQAGKFVPTNSQWRTDIVNPNTQAAGQANVMFSFLNRGHYGQPIYLDNINLAFPTPTLSASNSTTICINSAYNFTNTSSGAASYTWNFQGGTPATFTGTNPSVTYANAGTYTFTLFGVNGTASASVTKTITVLGNPTVTATSANYCSGNTYTLNGNGASSYTWADASGIISTSSSLVFIPLANSLFTLTGNNGNCSSQAIYTINVISSPTISVSDKTICAGSSATLSASGATSYSWSTSATGSFITVSPGSTTNYIVTGTSGNCSTTKTINVSVAPVPVSALNTSAPLCHNSCDGAVNASTSGGSAPYIYSLSNSTCTTLPCSGLCAGIYTLQTTNVSGCTSFTLFTITAPSVLQSVVSVSNAACSSCATGSLFANASGGVAPYTYTWSPSGGNAAQAFNLLPGCYTVSIKDANGCTTETNSCVQFNTGLPNYTLNNSLLIYPNPAKESVTLELNGKSFDFVLYNNLGQLIFSKKDNQNTEVIDLNNFAKGVYLIEVSVGKEVVRKKLLVD